MPAQNRVWTTLVAVGFAVAMVALGLLNPNAATGRAGCGLVCEAPVVGVGGR
jgi:hypothetical protein